MTTKKKLIMWKIISLIAFSLGAVTFLALPIWKDIGLGIMTISMLAVMDIESKEKTAAETTKESRP